jgi:phosphoribosylaminoimidazole-succinocarboxamide synthase
LKPLPGSILPEACGEAMRRASAKYAVLPCPKDLKKNQKLAELLITPSTKGIICGVEGIPEIDDVNITRDQILSNLPVFNFRNAEDVATYERLLSEGFNLISAELDKIGKVFVDTKFEFGFVGEGEDAQMIYIDEIGTPDSSRYWDKKLYQKGEIREDSKEFFREMLQANVPDKDVLLNKNRMDERKALADTFRLKDEQMMEVSRLYVGLAEQITGKKLLLSELPRAEIFDSLAELGLVK